MAEYLTHALLLGGDVLATVVVGWGILWEAPEQPKHRHEIAKWFVILGIAFETVCSISLFLYDESISHQQQSKIIALEARLAARSLTDDQIAEMTAHLKPFAPQEFAVVTYPSDQEAVHISEQIRSVLVKAGWIDKPYGGVLIGVVAGVTPLFDNRTPSVELAAIALVDALNANHIDAASGGVGPPTNEPVNSRITIEVGIKP